MCVSFCLPPPTGAHRPPCERNCLSQRPQLLQVNECHFVCGTQPRSSRNVTRLL